MDTHTLLALSDLQEQINQMDLYHLTPFLRRALMVVLDDLYGYFNTGICDIPWHVEQMQARVDSIIRLSSPSPFDPQEDTREWLRTLVTG
jgi:hypothetical protein